MFFRLSPLNGCKNRLKKMDIKLKGEMQPYEQQQQAQQPSCRMMDSI
jgi:hypothetical protein